MARVELAPGVAEDLDRIPEHLEQHDIANTASRVQEIIEAICVLERNPFIGRPAERDLRELITGRRARGYVALYRYVPEIDTVFVLALRSQQEARYSGQKALLHVSLSRIVRLREPDEQERLRLQVKAPQLVGLQPSAGAPRQPHLLG